LARFPASSLFAFCADLQLASFQVSIILPFLFLSLSILAMSTVAAVASNSFYRHLPLQVKRLSPQAVLPTRGSDFAAGLDLSAAESLTIPPGERALVKTDLSIACPPGTYARIAPRSGLAYKHGIDVGAGVIDADYRGPLGVILFNFGKKEFSIQVGDRIAQLILEQIVLPDVVECDGNEELPAVGVRGSAGFGSTGVGKGAEQSDESSSAEVAKKQRTGTISPSESAEEGEGDTGMQVEK
jgi:dUTP pyrophosphatase